MAKRMENGDGRPTHDEIATKARALYEQSGRVPGRDLQNWLEAEAQLMAARKPMPGPAPTVKVPLKPAIRQ